MVDFVVDLVEERVGLGGSQFSESILEHLCSAHASQQNVVTLEFGSPCLPQFFHDLTHCRTVFPVTGLHVRSEEPGSSRKKCTSISGEWDVFLSSLRTITSCVITGLPFAHELDLEFVGSIGNF